SLLTPFALAFLFAACSSTSSPPTASDAGDSNAADSGDAGTKPHPQIDAAGIDANMPDPGPSGWLSIVGKAGIYAQTFDDSSWSTRTVGPLDLYAVSCVGNEIGWVAGAGGAIAHTENGGRTWAAQASPFTTPLRAIRFATTLSGVVAGDLGALATSADGG